MSDFEYIAVLLSIILGLGITQLLSGIARLVRDGRALAPAWWIMVIVAVLLVMHFQVWWASFGWRHIETWTFFSYVSFMVLPMLLFLLAYLILPADPQLEGRELVREFIARRRSFYLIIALIPAASFFQQWMLGGPQTMVFDLDAGFRVLVTAFAIPGFLSRRVAVQAALALAYALLFAFYISLVFVQMR
jgi:hypothetical protein